MNRQADPEAIRVSYEGGPYASRYSGGEPDMGPVGYQYPGSSRKSQESLTGIPAQMPFTLSQPSKPSSPATIQPLETSYTSYPGSHQTQPLDQSYTSYSGGQRFPRQLEQEQVASMSQSMSQKAALVTPTQSTAPSTFLPLSILVTILFCPLTGAAAIFYSLRARARLQDKHYGAADGFGCIALCFIIISIVIGVTFYITVITMAATRYHFVPYGYGNGNEIG